RGTTFFKWAEKNRDSSFPNGDFYVQIFVDPGGHTIYWRRKDVDNSEPGHVFIDEIVDVRASSIHQLENEPGSDLFMTIVSNVDFVHPKFHTFMHRNDPKVTKKWSHFIFALSLQRRKEFHGMAF
ncbi:hypothetical protein PFISCL1PPCAC_2990, partial [Pristionchus fissidentatus]